MMIDFVRAEQHTSTETITYYNCIFKLLNNKALPAGCIDGEHCHALQYVSYGRRYINHSLKK